MTPTEDDIVKLQKAIGVDRLQAIYHLRGRAAIGGKNPRPPLLNCPTVTIRRVKSADD